MSIIVEGHGALYLGCQAALLDDNRELAWAEKHVIRNPAYKYVLGRFVEANRANDNGHLFKLDELRAAQASINHSPMNMLHRPHHIVGSFVATEMVYPVSAGAGGQQSAVAAAAARSVYSQASWTIDVNGNQDQIAAWNTVIDPTTTATTAAGDELNPYVDALAAFWRYYFPDEYAAVEEAHAQGSLYYSMECVPEQFECIADGCGGLFAYEGRQSANYCEHLNAAGSTKVCRNPHFTGGALIIPPVRPGWKRADITELSSLIEANLELAEQTYDQISTDFSHLEPREWEAMMAVVLDATIGKDFSAGERKKAADKGNAMGDGSFPINNVADLKRAIQAFGRAKDKAKAKAHIIKRAKALGATNLLPDGWS